MPVATPTLRTITVRSALAGLWLIAALFIAMAIMAAIGEFIGHEANFEDPAFVVTSLITFSATGALWARILARAADRGLSWRIALVAGLSYAVTVHLSILALSAVEQNLGSLMQMGLPIHRLFMLAFTLAALFIAGTTCGVLGFVLGDLPLAGRLALTGGLAGALAFLLVAVILDTLGYRVGAPGAEERFTMLITTLVGLLAAALAGSAVVGRTLAVIAARIRAPLSLAATLPEN